MKSLVKKFLLSMPFAWRYHFTSNVHKHLSGVEKVLELGCGVHSYIGTMPNKPYSVGVDIYEPSAREAKEKGIYDEVYVLDVMDISSKFPPKSFDVVMAMDLIEHLKKEDGIKLLEMIEKIAKKRIIIYTPNGYLEQGAEYGNEWQRHLSGWSAKEMQEHGYLVSGWGGLKILRPQFIITRWPVVFWKLVQSITQLYTRDHPRKAFQILCVKELTQ